MSRATVSLLLAMSGCVGAITPGKSGDDVSNMDPTGVGTIGATFKPVVPCDELLPQRVTRLTDRQLSNAMGDIFLVDRPVFQTGALDEESFLPAAPALVSGAVGTQLQSISEALSRKATVMGSTLLACNAERTTCARNFVNQYGARAFRRPLSPEEQAQLYSVYEAGYQINSSHSDGISLLIEALLQSPSFIYLSELGTAQGDSLQLTPHELASKLSFFFTDTVPDAELQRAADSGGLATEEQVRIQVARLLALPETQRNLTTAFSRLFGLDALKDLRKEPEVQGFSAQLALSMKAESEWLIHHVLWESKGQLSELFTSRQAKLDERMSTLYQVSAAAGTVTDLPAEQRAGILTRAGVMAVKAAPDDTSVVHRGLLVARGLLCSSPPPPSDAAMAAGDQLKQLIPTERERAIARMERPGCTSCHSGFDPFGIALESYDTIGAFRTQQQTPSGPVAIDTKWNVTFADLNGEILNGVDLSIKLANSQAARQCIAEKFASLAWGERLPPELRCTTAALAQGMERTGGNLKALFADIATWRGLSKRKLLEAQP